MGTPEITINMYELELGLPATENNQQYKEATAGIPQSEDITLKLKHQPWLDNLNEFLDPSKRSFAVPLDHRLTAFDVEVVHISESGEVDAPIKCNDAAAFKQAISRADKERGGTLVIAQDLSRALIDTLSMQYDLEPEFFACHLLGTESFQTGIWESPTVRPPPRSPNVLPDFVRKAPFYTVEFRRPFHIPGGLKELVELRSKKTSTPRPALMLKHDMSDAFIFEKISVYKRRGSNFGVILTDKLLSKDLPASYMLDIIEDNSNARGNGGRRNQISSQKELTAWLQELKPQDAKALLGDHEPLALRPVLKIVERTSAAFLSQARYILRRLLFGHFDKQLPDSIPNSLRVSRALHANIHDQQEILRLAMRITSLRGGGDFAEQMQDLKFLTDDMECTMKALEEDVRFLASVVSMSEGKVVGWISKFAFLFLPVSLLSTILTIDDDYIRFAILGGLSVPFVLISTYFIFFWKPADIDSLRSYTPTPKRN